MTDYIFTVRGTDSAGRVATSDQTLPVAPWSPDAAFSGGARGIWIDPSDSSTIFQDSAGTVPVTAVGQSVGKILDKSGNGNHLTQSTSAYRPVWAQDASGFYYLHFTPTGSTSGQWMTAGTTATLAPRTQSWQSVVGGKFDDGNASRSFFARSKANGVPGRYSNHRTGSGMLINFWDSSGTGGIQSGVTDTDTTTRIVSGVNDRQAGQISEYVNRTVFGDTIAYSPDDTTDRNQSYRFLLGAYNDSSDTGIINPLNGRIYGLFLIFNVDASTRSRAESFIAAKCGLML